MLIDNITLLVKAGDGGRGASTFLRNSQTARGGPDGGNGGNGANIYFQGTTNLTDLREFRFKKSIRAQDGINGKKHDLFGKNAQDLTILVPLGTRITDRTNGKVIEIENENNKILLA